MKWTHDIDPISDNYTNTSTDKARVMHMVHKRAETVEERDELIRMFFAPMNPARARA